MYHVRSMYDDHEYTFKRCHRYELSLNSAIAVSGCVDKQTKATLEICGGDSMLVCDWGVVVFESLSRVYRRDKIPTHFYALKAKSEN
jgi:hypothetical protein